MKIIFLDIDGVLNSIQNSIVMDNKVIPYSAEGINKTSLGLLKWVCDVTEANIVISSLWRRSGIQWITGIFEAHGWRNPPIIGVTPTLNTPRGKEIYTYIAKEIENSIYKDNFKYVIIDDDSDMLPEQQNNFVQTDPLVGFNIYDALKCIDILEAKKDVDLVKQINEHAKFRVRDSIKKVVVS